MKTMIPDYYREFSCLMSACRHSCCRGWEIDIDPDSLKTYRRLPGLIGERLRRSICEDENGAHFCMTGDDRCPFLNDRGLCDLILSCGKDILCDICSDHPLYRNYLSDREELGLGLCCESACRLILNRREPICLFTEADDGADEPIQEEEEILALRETLLGLAQDRCYPVLERVSQIEVAMKLAPVDLSGLFAFAAELETMDPEWTKLLSAAVSEYKEIRFSADEELMLENLLSVLLLRHISAAADADEVPAWAGFCTAMWRMIVQLYLQGQERSPAALEELCRMYSSEIEYSDENPSKLAEWVMENCTE